MARLTPKQIIERHEKFPESTEKLIEAYAFEQYKKAISDLQRFGKIVKVENTDTALVAISQNDLDNYLDYQSSHWYLNNCNDLP